MHRRDAILPIESAVLHRFPYGHGVITITFLNYKITYCL